MKHLDDVEALVKDLALGEGGEACLVNQNGRQQKAGPASFRGGPCFLLSRDQTIAPKAAFRCFSAMRRSVPASAPARIAS